ncbi:MAG TPA: site-specific integrase [Roseiarcus sp.]|nr:site-specific integrase [Roseiarcus sp.]
MKLTQRRIETLECPAGKKDALVFDDEQRGLGVRVTKGGGKTYLAQYTIAGSKCRIPLGSCPAISLAAAREAVQAILGDVAKGRDPAAERKRAAREAKEKAEAEALTLGVLIDRWETGHLAGKRPRYAAEAPRALRFAFKKHLTAPATDLTPKAVKAVLNVIADDGRKATAQLSGAYGRACYGWAIGKDLLVENPFARLKLVAVASRERVLSDEELVAIWGATKGPGVYNAIVRMLILTGQRRAEVAGMTWREIAPDLSTWTIPAGRTKNRTAHIVPLSPQVQTIIKSTHRTSKDDVEPEFVFRGLAGAFNGFSKAKTALDEDSGVVDWRLHDLRRSMATGLQKLGVRLEVTEAVLNHVSGSRAGIVGVYQRHEWADEKRAALNACGEHIAVIVEGRTAADNVTQLRRSS